MNDWSNLGQEAAGMNRRRGPKCGIAVLFERVSPKGRAAIQSALDDRSLSSAAIMKALTQRLGDSAPSLWTVSNHRRGYCKCGRESGK